MASDKNIILDFIEESKEHLASSEDDILCLERNGADVDEDTVHRFFRAVHTVKGGAGFFSLKNIPRLAHALENVVGLVRNKALVPDSDICEKLLKGVDKLKAMLDDIASEAQADISAEVEELNSISESETSDEIPVPASAEKSVGGEDHSVIEAEGGDKKDGAGIFVLSAEAMKKVREQNKYLYEVAFDVVAECRRSRTRPSEILKAIPSVFKVWDSRPTMLSDEDYAKGALQSFPIVLLVETIVADPKILDSSLDIAEMQIRRFDGPALKMMAEQGSPLQGVPHPPEASRNDKTPPEKKKGAAPPPHAEKEAPERQEVVKAVKSSGATLRIPLSLLDRLMNLVSELVLVRNQNTQAMETGGSAQLAAIAQQLNIVTSELQTEIMHTRMQPVDVVFSKFVRIVRDLSKKLSKETDLEIIGKDVELDKTILEAIGDPLTHLIRNSLDHGIEIPDEREKKGKPRRGSIVLSASHQAGLVNIIIKDDGGGIDPAKLRCLAVEKGLMRPDEAAALDDRSALELIFMPGFSTAKVVTDVSGRGVGMDVVRTSIQNVGGIIEIESAVGRGTSIIIKLPLTMAIIPTLIVTVGKQVFAIPQSNISEVVWLHGADVYQKIEQIDNQEVYWLRGKLLPVLRLDNILGIEKNAATVGVASIAERRDQLHDRRQKDGDVPREKRSGPLERRESLRNSLFIVIIRLGSDRYGLVVDDVLDNEEIVVKPLHDQLKSCEAFAGTTVLGDGRIALILDTISLAKLGAIVFSNSEKRGVSQQKNAEELQPVLIFDTGGRESFTVPLCVLSRVEHIRRGDIKTVSQKEYLPFRGNVIPLIRLENVIGGLEGRYQDDLCVLVPKCNPPMGVLVSRVQDNLILNCDIESSSMFQEGIVGSLLHEGRLLLFLDIFAIIEKSMPGWLISAMGKEKKHRKALLLEDSIFYSMLLTSFLRGAGVEVVHAKHGKEGMEKLLHNRCDFIISDIMMPEMDGYEFASWVRSQEAFSVLPMYALTSTEDDEAQRKAMDAGFNGFFRKQDREAVIEALRKLSSSGQVAV